MVRFVRTTVVAAFLASAACFLHAEDEVWTADGLSDVYVVSLAAGPGVRYAGTDMGIFRSTEPGVWTALADSPFNARVLEVDPTDPRTVYAGGAWGVEKSTDSGQTFQRLAGAPAHVRALAVDPMQPQTISVGTWESLGDTDPRLWSTTDGGLTWTGPSRLVLSNRVNGVRDLVADPTRPGTFYAGSGFSQPLHPPYEFPDPPTAPVSRSSNAGLSWTTVMTQQWEREEGVRDWVFTFALAVDARSGTLYAGMRNSGNPSGGSSVCRSADAGATWTRGFLGAGVYVTELLVDPNVADVIYAGTDQHGVYRSVDGGASWSPMGTGLPGGAWYLAYDPLDGMLRASAGTGIYAVRTAPPPCAHDDDHLCLRGRYRVGVTAENPRTGHSATGAAIPGGSRFGSFSLPAFTGDATLPEVFVKVVEPAGSRWIFYGGLTSLPYTLTVTDMLTGAVETYANAPENHFCGGVDGNAFPAEGVDACSGCWDYVQSAGAADEGANGTLSLLEGRFSIALSAFSSRHNRTEPGVAVAKTDRYGYFTLPGFTGDASFPEVHVKMVDYTRVSGNFWLFYTGLTSLDYTLTVTDTVTGAVQTFESPGDYCGNAATLPGS
jgi:hypothetical protein